MLICCCCFCLLFIYLFLYLFVCLLFTFLCIFLQYDWLRYLHLVFEDAGVSIDKDEPVVLWMKQYYDELFPLLQKTSNRYCSWYVHCTWYTCTLRSVFEIFTDLSAFRFSKSLKHRRKKNPYPKQRLCPKTSNMYVTLFRLLTLFRHYDDSTRSFVVLCSHSLFGVFNLMFFLFVSERSLTILFGRL